MPLPLYEQAAPSGGDATRTREDAAGAPAAPNPQAGGDSTAGTKTESELEAERRYEEAIEEEYAKREGGA